MVSELQVVSQKGGSADPQELKVSEPINKLNNARERKSLIILVLYLTKITIEAVGDKFILLTILQVESVTSSVNIYYVTDVACIS